MVSKYVEMEMEFLLSHGTKDLWSLVNLCDKFFNSQNIAAHEEMGVTMFLLIGKAQLRVNKLKQGELGYSRMCSIGRQERLEIIFRHVPNASLPYRFNVVWQSSRLVYMQVAWTFKGWCWTLSPHNFVTSISLAWAFDWKQQWYLGGEPWPKTI